MVFIIIQMVGYGLLFHFIYSLRKHDIHPIFILEGGYPEKKIKQEWQEKKIETTLKRKHYLLKKVFLHMLQV